MKSAGLRWKKVNLIGIVLLLGQQVRAITVLARGRRLEETIGQHKKL